MATLCEQQNTLMTLPAELRLMVLRNLLFTRVHLADRPTIIEDADQPGQLITRPLEEIKQYDLVPCGDGDEIEQEWSDGNDSLEASGSDDEELQQIRETGQIHDCPIDPARTVYQDEQYLDRPDIEKVEKLDDEQWLQGINHNIINEGFASRRRFTLHPDILRVCRQLRNEGYPLLYNDKTIEVTFLRGFDYVTKYYHAEYARRSYCMGRRSIKSALIKWPALKRFRNWAYNIYIGPCDDGDHRKESSLTGLNHDLHTLYDLPINKLTIGCFRAYEQTTPDSDDSETESNYPVDFVDDSTVEACVMPFYTLTCNSVVFDGRIGPHIATQLQHYLLQRRLLPLFETWCMVDELAHGIGRLVKQRNPCTCFKKEVAQVWNSNGSQPCSRLRIAQEKDDMNEFYTIFNDYMSVLDRILKLASRRCTTCGSEGQLQEDISEDLEMLQDRWHKVAQWGAVPMTPALCATWTQQKASWRPL